MHYQVAVKSITTILPVVFAAATKASKDTGVSQVTAADPVVEAEGGT